jgi:hypothetical protein
MVAMTKARLLLATLAIGASTLLVTAAWAAPTVTVHANMAPDALDASTNISATAQLATVAAGEAITKVAFYAPAGLSEDLSAIGTCAATKLEMFGPSGCPADSRAGFGGGLVREQLGDEVIHERFTIDIFLASPKRGHLSFLAYALATSPVSVELILKARQIPAPKPYGLGFSVEVPSLLTLPGASNPSIESAFVTLGSPDVAYYKTINGKRTLVHIRGLVAPARCPSGGFPLQVAITYATSATTTSQTAIPCPGR